MEFSSLLKSKNSERDVEETPCYMAKMWQIGLLQYDVKIYFKKL